MQSWIDTTYCQGQSYPDSWMAAATTCYFSYMLRMNLLRLLTIYFKALFIRLPMNASDVTNRELIANEMANQIKLTVVSLGLMFFYAMLPTWMKHWLANEMPAKDAFYWIFTIVFFSWSMYGQIHDLIQARREDSVRRISAKIKDK